MKQHLKRALEVALVPFAAAVVFFEQTLIKYLNVVMEAVARWPPIARLEAWLVRLRPYAALAAFVAPSILILPIKLVALWFAAMGLYGLAFGAVIVGKMLATAVLARLYRILRPTLMTIPWFAKLDTWFFYWRDQAYAFVRSLASWQRARAVAQRVRARLAVLVSDLFAR
ncbi:hypothetical protein BH10PSE6_BH10PSE6_13400 [soil metagenome]